MTLENWKTSLEALHKEKGVELAEIEVKDSVKSHEMIANLMKNNPQIAQPPEFDHLYLLRNSAITMVTLVGKDGVCVSGAMPVTNEQAQQMVLPNGETL